MERLWEEVLENASGGCMTLCQVRVDVYECKGGGVHMLTHCGAEPERKSAGPTHFKKRRFKIGRRRPIANRTEFFDH